MRGRFRSASQVTASQAPDLALHDTPRYPEVTPVPGTLHPAPCCCASSGCRLSSSQPGLSRLLGVDAAVCGVGSACGMSLSPTTPAPNASSA